MPGRQHRMASRGGSYEDLAQALLGRIASLVRVPRRQDFGIDFYCQPRFPSDQEMEAVGDLCSIQVKGGSRPLTFGGNKRGQWREYHFEWLKSLATPLFLAIVDPHFEAVELYSLWPLWYVFWSTSTPFSVMCITRPSMSSPYVWQPPAGRANPNALGKGDGQQWEIDLGPPFLRLTSEALNDDTFRYQALNSLTTFITYDQRTLIRFHLGVAVLEGITSWSTNGDQFRVQKFMFWSRAPGANVERLCSTIEPILVNLGVNLQWQNDVAAYAFIPMLEWLADRGYLDELGKGLLEGLRQSRTSGLPPAP